MIIVLTLLCLKEDEKKKEKKGYINCSYSQLNRGKDKTISPKMEILPKSPLKLILKILQLAAKNCIEVNIHKK